MSNSSAPLVLHVNGSEVAVNASPETPLLFVLRNELGLKGAKLGCGLEQCGACAVLADGKKVLSCSAPVGEFAGKKIVTPECADEETLRAVREAFVRAGAAQCGYCIPGMVIAAAALVSAKPDPSEEEIREALQQHLCRCGTHKRVLAAIGELTHG